MKSNSFGAILFQLRKNSGLKREELAEYLGCSSAAVGNYENGNRNPDFDTLVKIADKFNVSTDYLLGRSENKTTDIKIQAICDYTGLSENSIETLNLCKNVLTDPRSVYFPEININSMILKFFDFFLDYYRNSYDGDFISLLCNYQDDLKHGSELSTAYLQQIDLYKKLDVYYEMIQNDKLIRCDKYDLQVEIMNIIESFFKEDISRYHAKKDFVERTINNRLTNNKDGEPNVND